MEHTCDAAVIACIDFRFWRKLIDTLENKGVGSYDLIGMAGGAKNLIDEDTRTIVFRQLDICTQKHGIKAVYLVNHIDCGAYGGSQAFETPEKEEEKLTADLLEAKKLIAERYPDLEIKTILMDFDSVRDIDQVLAA